MEKREPPKALVETWLHLITRNDAKLKEHGHNMLLGAFEDMQAVSNFKKKHHINLE